MGFEPTRAEHIGSAVQRLNHSAASSDWCNLIAINKHTGPASYPDVSLKMCAQRKAGRTLPMVPCGSSPVTRFALASAMRKTKRLRRRLITDKVAFQKFRQWIYCNSIMTECCHNRLHRYCPSVGSGKTAAKVFKNGRESP